MVHFEQKTRFIDISDQDYSYIGNSIISKNAKIGTDVKIGPFCFIEDNVIIGNGSILLSHVNIKSGTKMGEKNVCHPFSVIGSPPQDLKYQKEQTSLEIGTNNCFREGVTISIGTIAGGGATTISHNNLFMANSHVGHDSHIGNECILANSVAVAGHVKLEDNVLIGGNSAIHQFVRLGRYSVVGGMSGVTSDLIPFGLAYGDRAIVKSINMVGLKRSNTDKEEIRNILKILKILYSKESTLSQNIDTIKTNFANNSYANEIIHFVELDSKRQILPGDIEG